MLFVDGAVALQWLVCWLCICLLSACPTNVSCCPAVCFLWLSSPVFVCLSASLPGCQLAASVCLLSGPFTDSQWLREAWSVSLSWPDFKIDSLARTPCTHYIAKTGLSLFDSIVLMSGPRWDLTHLWVMASLNHWCLQLFSNFQLIGTHTHTHTLGHTVPDCLMKGATLDALFINRTSVGRFIFWIILISDLLDDVASV